MKENISANNEHINKGLQPLVQTGVCDGIEKPYHITWVTHNSRTSQRMIEYKVKKGEPILLSEQQEIEITSYILQIIKEDNLKIFAYNICKDHIHILLLCEENKRDNIVRKLKGKSTQFYKKNNNIQDKFSLWAQKYNCSYLEDNEEKLLNTIAYINNNREKHRLTINNGLQPIVQEMTISFKEYLKITNEKLEKTQ